VVAGTDHGSHSSDGTPEADGLTGGNTTWRRNSHHCEIGAIGQSAGVDVEQVLASLTIDEQIALLAGVDSWTTAAIPAKGVPAVRVTDGPNGTRGTSWTGPRSACFPCGTALASTWDTELIERVGVALGKEARAKGARVLLAPTVNLHRTPIGGRNFECMSEDPILTARMATAYVTGVQSQRVATCIKHFVANDTEFERMTISSDVDERTLRELYLVPFEAVAPITRSLMTAYNKVNGIHAADHRWLLDDVLRNEFGFTGLTVSDWFGLHSTIDGLTATLDLEMPGPSIHRGALVKQAFERGEIDETPIRASARRLLELIDWTGADVDGEPGNEITLDDPEIDAVIYDAAIASTTLFSNNGLLPLATGQRIAVIGPNAIEYRIQGGGSASVRPKRVATIDQALAALGQSVTVEQGCRTEKVCPPINRRNATDLTVTYRHVADDGTVGDVVHTDTTGRLHQFWNAADAPTPNPQRYDVTFSARFMPTVTGEWTFGIIAVDPTTLTLDGEVVIATTDDTPRGDNFFGFGTTEQRITLALVEGTPVDVEITSRRRGSITSGIACGVLPPEPADLMDRAVAEAAAADYAVLVVGTNNDWESEGTDRTTMDLPGRQNELIDRVLAAQPNTVVVVNAGSPVTMPWFDDAPAVMQTWFPGEGGPAALADVLSGIAEPGGRTPTTVPMQLDDTLVADHYPGTDGHVAYAEGVFIGHRWFEQRGITPRVPFGHGLGYTTWDMAEPRLAGSVIEGLVTVEVDVTNTGARSGSTVVQCYVRPPAGPVVRPVHELKGFAKVTAEPGATITARITLDRRAFARWDAGWVVDPGTATVELGWSSAAIMRTAALDLPG
jgi:beta-glucosidase